MLTIIKYPNANAIEATWLDAEGKQLKSTSYHESQMQLLRDDIALHGGDLTDFSNIIADVEANIQPAIIPTIEQIRAQLQPLSAWQVRKVLTQLGLRDSVETAVANADQATKDAWHYASNFQRDDAILNAMAVSLGITASQLDSMFELGITL